MFAAFIARKRTTQEGSTGLHLLTDFDGNWLPICLPAATLSCLPAATLSELTVAFSV
jgi:hypothetical protein